MRKSLTSPTLSVPFTKTPCDRLPGPANACWPRLRRTGCRIGWWPRAERYAERLAPGTKFADILGEIDPAKLALGASMSTEEALHFGLIRACTAASSP